MKKLIEKLIEDAKAHLLELEQLLSMHQEESTADDGSVPPDPTDPLPPDPTHPHS